MITVIETNPQSLAALMGCCVSKSCWSVLNLCFLKLIYLMSVASFVDFAWFSLAFYGKLEHWLNFGTFVSIS